MNRQLSIFVCETFAPEVQAVVELEGFTDVRIEVFPLHCGSPSMSAKNILEKLEPSSLRSSHLHYLVSNCFHLKQDRVQLPENITFTHLTQCFDLVLPSRLTNSLIHEKNYLVSSGWLPSFKQQILRWGFDENTAKRFFGETASQLLLVDTGLRDDAGKILNDVSRFIGLPCSTIDIGLNHCQLLIRGIVLEWRYQREQKVTMEQLRKITRESADYSMAFNQISQLAEISDEQKIMVRISEMIRLLFAPSRAFFEPDNAECRIPAQELISGKPVSLPGVSQGASFTIQLTADDRKIGRIDISNISFPQYLKYYQKLSPILGKIFGLVLSNASKYTTIKNNEKQLEVNSAELRDLNATKDKFFSIIAHDLRSPFNSLLGFINLFLDGYDDFTDVEKKDFMLRIQGIAKNTYRLVENLLDWAGAQSGNVEIKPDAVSIQKLILDNIDIFESIASKKNIRLRINRSEDFIVFADRYSLDAIIRNLINNAVKFTGAGGEVTVYYYIKEQMGICSVADTGIGIPEALIDQLFRLDSHVKRSGTASETGTGLGLILCKDLVELNGGEIWVESEEGKGTTFSFSVPLFDGPRNLDK